MQPSSPKRVTQLLHQWRGGNRAALEELLIEVYDELRRLARRHMRRERDGHTLDTTGLVHEAYLRLATQRRLAPADRREFFNATVTVNNVEIRSFPYLLFARAFGMRPFHLFVAEPESGVGARAAGPAR